MKRFKIQILALFLILLCLPSTAMAQSSDPEQANLLLFSLTTSYYGIPLFIATSGGLATTGGVILTVMIAKKSNTKMEMYLRRNEAAVAQSLTTGFGQSTNDLATIFNIPTRHKPAFAKLLKANRKTLLPLSNVKQLNATRTRAFISHIVHSMHKTTEFKHMVKLM